MLLSRINDFLTDKRFPWVLRTQSEENITGNRKVFNNNQVYIALTFDVEQDGGSKGTFSVAKAESFLKNAGKNLGNRKATFYIQGDLIKHLAQPLSTLSKNIELGLHSFHHKGLWGDPVWFLSEKNLNVSEKREYLEKGIAAFQQSKLPRPVSFRAPNMIINKASLALLEEYGFTSDSSFPSFRDFAVPYKYGKIWEFPVSNLAVPRRIQRLGISIRDYTVFNMGNLQRLPFATWNDNIQNLFTTQSNLLIFLAHSWDFDKMKFKEMLSYIEEDRKVRYVTMTELAKMYE